MTDDAIDSIAISFQKDWSSSASKSQNGLNAAKAT